MTASPPKAPDRIEELLVEVARAFAGRGSPAAVRRRAAMVTDWEAAAARAQEHGVLAVVRRVLTDVGAPAVPERARALLAGRAADAGERSRRLEAEARGVAGTLRERGVRALTVRGPAAVRDSYPDPALRPFGGLDLLLAEEDWPGFRDAMLALGAKPRAGGLDALPPRLTSCDGQERCAAFTAPGGLEVSVAFDALRLGLRSRTGERIAEEAEPLVSLPGLLRPPAEERLVVLAVDLNREGFRRLAPFIDLAELLRAHPALDWGRVAGIAREEGVLAPVTGALVRVGELLALELPEGSAALRPSPLARAVWSRYWPPRAVLSEGRDGPLVFPRDRVPFPPAPGWTWPLANLAITGRLADKAALSLRRLVPRKSFLLAGSTAEDPPPYASLWIRRFGGKAREYVRPLFGPAPPGRGVTEQGDREADIGRKFSRGVAWNTAAKMSTRAIQFLVTIVLARLLVPADFGLAEMAAIVTMLVGMVAEFGFAHALVQKSEVTEEDTRTAMTLSVLFATALASAGIAASGVIAGLFNAEQLRYPLMAACSGMIVASVGITPRAMLIKRFDFRSMALADFAGCVVYGVTGIALAVYGAGVWSLVLAGLGMICCQTAVLVVRSRVPLRPLVDLGCARHLVPFGARVFGTNLLDYMRANLDYLVIGRALGPAALGVYTIAFRIADFPRSRLVTTVSEVAFSAMSSVQEDVEMLRRTYRRSLATAALFAFPLLFGFTAFAPEFVYAVYGAKWMGAVQPLRILMPMSVLLIVAQQSAMLLVAKGEPGSYLRLGAMYALGVGVGAVAGVRYGTTGVALGVLAATALYYLASSVLIWKRASIDPALTAKAIAVPSVSGALMFAAALAYRAYVPFPSGAAALLWLAAGGVLSASVYAAGVLLGGAVAAAEERHGPTAWAAEGERMMEQLG